jgi:Ran GTPase-activating protein 1
MLIKALMGKDIVHLNLSDNAFGPAGIKAFDFLLRETPSLKTFKVNNCGLGPEGAEMIADALKENKDLKLKHFTAGRDRLENKGITALSRVFKDMQSLEVIEVPQNGIKEDGMLALMEALKANAETLREVHINDNWIKKAAVDKLVEFIYKAKKLEKLNISDLNMDPQAVKLVFRALKDSPAVSTLKELYCNYNEIESSKLAKECLDIMLNDLKAL